MKQNGPHEMVGRGGSEEEKKNRFANRNNQRKDTRILILRIILTS